MTLFRKVFQSQARPAQESEAPDPDDLRRAMAENAGEVSPLVLAPEDSVEDAAYSLSEEIEEKPYDKSQDEPDALQAPEESDIQALEMQAELMMTDDKEPSQSEEIEDDEPDLAAIMSQAAADQDNGISDEAESEDWSVQERDEESGEEIKLPNQNPDQILSEPSGGESASVAPVDIADFARRQMLDIGVGNDAVENNGSSEAQSVSPPRLDLSNAAKIASHVSRPDAGTARPAGRVRTRLLGFNRDKEFAGDPLGQAGASTPSKQHEKFPVGWLVVTEGPGMGHAFSIFTGASTIGRGDDQTISLNFGDTSISRENHAAIAYDEEVNKFYIGHGGKSNIIRRNARLVLSTEELNHADLLRIGETTLRFVALCGSDFQWNASEDGHAAGV